MPRPDIQSTSTVKFYRSGDAYYTRTVSIDRVWRKDKKGRWQPSLVSGPLAGFGAELVWCSDDIPQELYDAVKRFYNP